MNKIMKKLLFLLTLTLSFTISSAVAFAETSSENTEQPVIEASSENSTESKSSEELIKIESSLSTGNLVISVCQIKQLSSIYVEGICEANSTKLVSEIGYTITFEKLQNGKWVSIGSFNNSTKNDYSIESSHIQKVTSGAYYRVRIVSYIVDNGVRTTKTTVSNSIFVY